jgi:hypothetical protein
MRYEIIIVKFRKLKNNYELKAFHARVEDDAVAFLLAHIGAENMVSSLNEKSPVPFKELNWSNLDRFRQKTQGEPENKPEIKQMKLRHSLPRSRSRSKQDPNEIANRHFDASDTDFDPDKDNSVYKAPKIRSKPRKRPNETMIRKVAKPKSPSKRGRRAKDNSEPTSSSTIEIDQEAQWILKANKIWNGIFHKVGGRVYGSGVSLFEILILSLFVFINHQRSSSNQSPIRKTGLIWTQRYICLGKGPNDETCQARVIMSVYTNDPRSILVREYQYHSHATADMVKPEE